MLAFIHVAKTGGQTIQKMLASSFGHRFCDPPVWPLNNKGDQSSDKFVIAKYSAADLRRLLKICPWLKCVGGHSVALWSDFDAVRPTTYFSMIRDPLKRGASHFQYNLQDDSQPPREWDDWVKWEVHHNHQVKLFSPQGSAEDAINRIVAKDLFVGLTERFDESLVILKGLIAPELNISYVRTNTAADNAIAHSLLADPDACDILSEIYREEFILYNFIKNEWYPRWQKKYGLTLEKDLNLFRQGRENNFNRVNYCFSRLNHHLVLRPAVLLSRG